MPSPRKTVHAVGEKAWTPNKALIATAVVSSERGELSFEEGPHTPPPVKQRISSAAVKYTVNTRVEVRYTWSETTSDMIIATIKEIPPDQLYDVALATTPGIPENPTEEQIEKFKAELYDRVSTHFTDKEASKAVTDFIINNNFLLGVSGPIPFAGDMSYDDAVNTAGKLSTVFQGTLTWGYYATTRKQEVAVAGDHVGEWVGDFWLSAHVRKLFDTVKVAVDANIPLVIGLVGPSGNGKSVIAYVLSQYLDLGICDVNCGAVSDVREWFGTMGAKNGNTGFEVSKLGRAMNAGSNVLLFDEITRAEGWMMNSLYSIFDDRRAATVGETEFKIGDRSVMIMTMNQGAKYTGTFSMDEALANRVDIWLQVGPPERQADEEAIIARAFPTMAKEDVTRVVAAIRSLRQAAATSELDIDLSVRVVKGVAKLVVLGMSLSDALRSKIIARLPDEAAKFISDALKARGIKV